MYFGSERVSELETMGCLGSKQKISKVDLEYLKKHTRYDEATIKEWFKGFRVSLSFFKLVVFCFLFFLHSLTHPLKAENEKT